MISNSIINRKIFFEKYKNRKDNMIKSKKSVTNVEEEEMINEIKKTAQINKSNVTDDTNNVKEEMINEIKKKPQMNKSNVKKSTENARKKVNKKRRKLSLRGLLKKWGK